MEDLQIEPHEPAKITNGEDYIDSRDVQERIDWLESDRASDEKYQDKEIEEFQEDQTGDISQYFVKWKNAHTINFCSNEKAEQCFATLYRVLP